MSTNVPIVNTFWSISTAYLRKNKLLPGRRPAQLPGKTADNSLIDSLTDIIGRGICSVVYQVHYQNKPMAVKQIEVQRMKINMNAAVKKIDAVIHLYVLLVKTYTILNIGLLSTSYYYLMLEITEVSIKVYILYSGTSLIRPYVGSSNSGLISEVILKLN